MIMIQLLLVVLGAASMQRAHAEGEGPPQFIMLSQEMSFLDGYEACEAISGAGGEEYNMLFFTENNQDYVIEYILTELGLDIEDETFWTQGRYLPSKEKPHYSFSIKGDGALLLWKVGDESEMRKIICQLDKYSESISIHTETHGMTFESTSQVTTTETEYTTNMSTETIGPETKTEYNWDQITTVGTTKTNTSFNTEQSTDTVTSIQEEEITNTYIDSIEDPNSTDTETIEETFFDVTYHWSTTDKGTVSTYTVWNTETITTAYQTIYARVGTTMTIM